MPNVKPILKLTDGQYKRLLERVISRGEGKAPVLEAGVNERFTMFRDKSAFNFPGELGEPRRDLLTGTMNKVPLVRSNPTAQAMPTFSRMTGPAPIDEVMASEPPRSVVMARLARQKEGIPFTEPSLIEKDYPYFEARRKYVMDPYSEENLGGYKPVNVASPKVKHLRTVPEGVTRGKNQDMGGGLNYSELRYKSVETPFERKVRKEAKAEPEIKASLEEIIHTGRTLENMWLLLGGKRSASGHTWNLLRQSSPGRNKVVDTKDYFIRSGLRWREDPVKFARQWPREAKLLNSIWDELSQSAEAGNVAKAKYESTVRGTGGGR